MQYFQGIIDAINGLPGKLLQVVATVNEPIYALTKTLVVTNVLLGILVVTSLANIYMLWRNGRR
ncbi:hypothetical protein ACFSO0_09095 [Brevibacillus sp. GCM10020057]|uniref:hypothetical protein n=1 Tax=Brevibacillus sp. GCM10020057 TaxID=3317327 RepID=UPI00363A1E4B